MAANGAQYGVSTVHFYWIGAVPAMVFLGLVMMPFYYGSRVHSVPEFLRRRYNHADPPVQRAGRSPWPRCSSPGSTCTRWPWSSRACSAGRPGCRSSSRRGFVLAYITLGGLSGAIYNEVLQFFVIIAGLIPIVIVGLPRSAAGAA